MSWLARTVAVFALASSPVGSDFPSGTILVVGFSKHKVVLAADSRINFGPSSHRDDDCKIAAVGDQLAFAATGFVSSPVDSVDGKWTAADVARAAAKSFKTPATVREIAAKWRNLVQPLMQRDFERKFDEVIAASGGSNFFAQGAFAGIDSNGQVSVVVVDFTFDRALRVLHSFIKAPAPTDEMNWIAAGEAEVAQEVIGRQTERGRLEAEKLDEGLAKASTGERDMLRATRLIELTYRLHPNRDRVGGPIDVLELEPGGNLAWRQRKPNCPEK